MLFIIMSRNIILLTIILLVGLLVWCWWMLRIETFTVDDQKTIDTLSFGLVYSLVMNAINFESTQQLTQLLDPYLNTHSSSDPSVWTYDLGVTGATGPRGNAGINGTSGKTGPRGIDGIAGLHGATGIQGVKGRDGSSIFDVSKYMLNGDTDIFKKKDKGDDDAPQPVNAYTTLFD